MELGAILDAAAARGIEYLGLSDHIDSYIDPMTLYDTRAELDSMQSGINVYLGCEADILGVGSHCVTERMIQDLDFISVAANHFHDKAVAQPEAEDLQTLARHYLDMFRYACTLDFADIVVHPLFVYPGTFDSSCLELITDTEIEECAVLARQNNIAMEISPRALAPDQLFFRIRFYEVCKRVGLKFSIGSDAHSLSNVGNVKILGELIDRLIITDCDIRLPSKVRKNG